MIFWLSLPPAALAQGPTDLCINNNGVWTNTLTIDFTGVSMPSEAFIATDNQLHAINPSIGFTCNPGWQDTPLGVHNSGIRVETWGGGGTGCDVKPYIYAIMTEPNLSFSSPISGVQTTVAFTGSVAALACVDDENNYTDYAGLPVSLPLGDTCARARLAATSDYLQYIESATITCGYGEYPITTTVQTCDLVSNADFTTTDDWLLGGSATITNSLLQLPSSGDNAAQNVSLTQYTSYQAVISTTSISGSFAVGLGVFDQQEVTISGAGTYTVTLTTGGLSGPISYWFENLTSTPVNIDYTCLSLAATGPGGEQYTCLAPPNGEFDTSTGWDYYRGAAWTAAENVTLPATNYGLIVETASFSMPTIGAGEYLLMSFDAYGHDGDGMIGSYASAGASENTGYYQVYETFYTYEADITDLAGGSSPYLSFVNVATDTLLADITLDNVCIFIADRPAQLPYPTDPGGDPPPPGGGVGSVTSCADVDSIWAGFGVNMSQYRADYAAGTSLWDPSGWVPWLVSAIFTTLADWSCLFLAAWYYVVNLITYLWSALTNLASWLWHTAKQFGEFLWAWFVWWGESALATYAAITAYLGGLIGYYFNVLRLIAAWLWEALKGYASAYLTFAGNIMDWLWQSLKGLGEGIIQAIITVVAWLLDYLYYLLISLMNVIVYGWNTFVATLGVIIGYIIDLAAEIWNSLVEGLQSIFNWLGLFWVFAELAWDFFYTIFQFAIALINWVIDLVLLIVWLPLDIINGIAAGFSAAPFDLISCDTGIWCAILYGVGVTNAVAGPGVLYPVMIGMIIFCTIQLIRLYIDDITDFVLTALREL